MLMKVILIVLLPIIGLFLIFLVSDIKMSVLVKRIDKEFEKRKFPEKISSSPEAENMPAILKILLMIKQESETSGELQKYKKKKN